MGWLCPRCGAENPLPVWHCRACGKKVSASFQIRAFLETYAENREDDAERRPVILLTVVAFRHFIVTYLRAGVVLCVLFSVYAMIPTVRSGNPFSGFDNLPVLFAQSEDLEREQLEKITRLCQESERRALSSGAAFREEVRNSMNSEFALPLSDEAQSTQRRVFAEMKIFALRVADISRDGASRFSQRWRLLWETLSRMREEQREEIDERGNLEES